MKESKWSESYVKRRLVYAAVVALSAVAVAFGFITQAQADQIETWLPLLISGLTGLGGGSLALANTHRGSDSTATGADVDRALTSGPDLGSLVQQLAPTVRTEVENAIGRVGSVVYGRHDAGRTAPEVEETDSYPSGVDSPSPYPGA